MMAAARVGGHDCRTHVDVQVVKDRVLVLTARQHSQLEMKRK